MVKKKKITAFPRFVLSRSPGTKMVPFPKLSLSACMGPDGCCRFPRAISDPPGGARRRPSWLFGRRGSFFRPAEFCSEAQGFSPERKVIASARSRYLDSTPGESSLTRRRRWELASPRVNYQLLLLRGAPRLANPGHGSPCSRSCARGSRRPMRGSCSRPS